MVYKTIKFSEPQEGLGLLLLNRPERLNALNLEMVEELHAFFFHLQNQERVRVLIITGAGRGFCAGADLKDAKILGAGENLLNQPARYLVTIQKKYGNLILEMRRAPQPIIAAVNGPAAGGGMSLALAADVIVATPQAYFVPSFINIGLAAGEMGSSYLLPRAVGLFRAAEILYTGRVVEAAEAEKIGLVSQVVPEEKLLTKAQEIAEQMLSKSALGLRLTKEILNNNLSAPSLEAAVEMENRNQSLLVAHPDFLKAVQNFKKEKK
ncbi:MAG: enoyl-CoA hydratase/isomerase family protein [bacterium]